MRSSVLALLALRLLENFLDSTGSPPLTVIFGEKGPACKGVSTMAKQDSPRGGKRHPKCAAMYVHRRLAAIDPEYRRRSRQLELEIRRFITRYRAQGLRTGVVRS